MADAKAVTVPASKRWAFSPTVRISMGLVSMRERAGLVNGVLDLENCASGGALVRLTVPAILQETHE